MIDLKKLRLYPFFTSDLAITTDENGGSYNVIFYPENSSFSNAYSKLKLKKRFIRYGSVVPSKMPRVIVSAATLSAIRANRLIPVRTLKGTITNMFVDTTYFMDELDKKYKKASYRRPIVSSKIGMYLNSVKQEFPDRKNILMYYIDLNKPFPLSIYNKRSWPLYTMFRSKEGIPFDYVILALQSGGIVKYAALSTPEKHISPARLFNIIKTVAPQIPEDEDELQETQNEEFSNQIVDTIQSDFETKNLGKDTKDVTGENALVDDKIKYTVKKYIEKENPEARAKMMESPVTPEEAQKLAIKSVIFNLTRDKDKASRLTNTISPSNYSKVLKNIKTEIAPDILEEDSYKNESRDMVFGKVNINANSQNKNPSKVLNKRTIDFKQSFEKDLKRSFTLLEGKKIPLKVVKFNKKSIPIDPGDLEPTKTVKYSISLKDDKGKQHDIEIDIPEIEKDGTFLINGKRKYLSYQIIIDPIFFLKKGQAVLQTMYASVATHLKETKHKSYFMSLIAGYQIPTMLMLSYYIGFDKTCDLFGITYNVEIDKPKDKNALVQELSDGKYLIFNVKDSAGGLLVRSLLEVPIPFTLKVLHSPEGMAEILIKFTGNRNCIYQIDSVLENIMEPIATQVLRSKMLPVTFERCINYICVELSKGRVDNRNDISKQRIRSSEILNYQIQKLIIGSYNDYRTKREHGDPDATYYCDTKNIVSNIINSQLMQNLENINPYEELASMTRISPIGPGGVSGKHGVTKPARNIDPSYYGNIDPMDTPENANVGINNHLTIDAAIGNARGSFGKFEPEIDADASILSACAVAIPYVSSCDGNRVMMGSGQTRQSIPINGKEQPLCQTGYETIMTSMLTEAYIKKSPVDGVISRQSENVIYVKDSKNSKMHIIPLDTRLLKSAQGKSSLNTFTSTVKDGQNVESGQIIAEGKHIDNGVISVGTNLLAAVMGWKGYSFEDGYVISEKIASQKFTSTSYEEIVVHVKSTSMIKFIAEEGKLTKKGEPLLIRSSKEVEDLLEIEEDELVEGQAIKSSPGGKIISLEVYPNVKISKFPILQKPFENFRKRYEEQHGKFPEKFLVNEAGNKMPFSGVRIVFKIERYDTCVVGDKMTNNHGGKGVITLIEKTENMPITPWGEPIDVILNPISIINRMNPSVLYELYTGLIAKFMAKHIVAMGPKKNAKALKLIQDVYTNMDNTSDKKISRNIIRAFRNLTDKGYSDYIKQIEARNFILPIIVPPFKAPTKEMIYKSLTIVGARTKYNLKLPDFGRSTINPVAVGYLYYKKLEQQAEYKLSARSVGRYESSTAQPVGGSQKGGGQRLGEFDTWALAGYGAEMVLRELMGPLSDDVKTKDKIIFDIVQNGSASYQEPKTGVAKDLLDIYTSGMMLDAKI